MPLNMLGINSIKAERIAFKQFRLNPIFSWIYKCVVYSVGVLRCDGVLYVGDAQLKVHHYFKEGIYISAEKMYNKKKNLFSLINLRYRLIQRSQFIITHYYLFMTSSPLHRHCFLFLKCFKACRKVRLFLSYTLDIPSLHV